MGVIDLVAGGDLLRIRSVARSIEFQSNYLGIAPYGSVVHRGTTGGLRHATTPTVLVDGMDDLSVVIDRKRVQRGYSIYGLARAVGWTSRSMGDELSRYLRTGETRLGIKSVLAVADHLDIPVRILCGDEARMQLAAPSLAPSIEDLSGVAA